MIWAALAAAIVAIIAVTTGGPDHWKELIHQFRKAIKHEVKDKDRRDKALAIIDAADADMLTARKQLVTDFKAAYDVHLSYESTKEDYLASVDKVMTDIHTVELQGMERRFELQEVLNPAEYNAVFIDVQEEIRKDDKKDAKKDAKQAKKDARKAKKAKCAPRRGVRTKPSKYIPCTAHSSAKARNRRQR